MPRKGGYKTLKAKRSYVRSSTSVRMKRLVWIRNVRDRAPDVLPCVLSRIRYYWNRCCLTRFLLARWPNQDTQVP